jgi:hypothetical protein
MIKRWFYRAIKDYRFFLPVWVCVMFPIFAALGRGKDRPFDASPAEATLAAIGISWIGFNIAYLLHRFKKANGLLYGIFESGVGFIVAIAAVYGAAMTHKAQIERITVFIGGIYGMKRGVDTFMESKEKAGLSRGEK